MCEYILWAGSRKSESTGDDRTGLQRVGVSVDAGILVGGGWGSCGCYIDGCVGLVCDREVGEEY